MTDTGITPGEFGSILGFLREGEESPDRGRIKLPRETPTGQPPRRGKVKLRNQPRTSDGRTYPVEVRNMFHGTHEGVRERALREAVERGVDPSQVKAVGPAAFEFTIG